MPLSVEIISLLVLLAAILAVSLVTLRERARAERRARNLHALFKVSQQATARLDQQQMLEVVVQAVQDVMGYRLASILLLDESRQELVSSAISSSLQGLIPLGDRVHISRGMVGAAARTGEVQLANDVSRDPHYVRAPAGWDPGSELSIPLKLQLPAAGWAPTPGDSAAPGLGPPRVIGVLDVQDRARNAFSQDDVQILKALAEQLVVILEKARLFESERQRAERIAIINRIGRLITASLTLPTDEVLALTLEAINTHLHYPHVALLLVDPAQPDTVVLRAKSGAYLAAVPGEYRQPTGQGLIGRAVRSRRRVLVNDVRADPDYIPVPGINSQAELAVPVQVGGQVIGVLNVEAEKPFSEEAATGLEIIADQLAIALDNARLFGDTQANLQRLSTLYDLSQRISLARDDDEVMRAALEALAARSPYRCTVALFEFDPITGQRESFHVPYYFQPGQGVQAADLRVPATDDDLNPPLDGGEIVAIADVNADPRVPGVLRAEQAAAGRPALALIPLMVGGRRIGNLVLSHTETHVWTEDELQLFRSSANQIAAAIENARRYETERERTARLGLIARVGQRIAARLNPDELLDITVEALHNRLGYDHVSIFLLDPQDPGWLIQRARASRWPRLTRGVYRQLADQGLLGAAAQKRAPELVNDVGADARFVPVAGAPEIRAELAVPILLGERLLGVLDAASLRRFGEDDLTGLTIVADQLAIALENAALYERAQEAGVLEERQRLARDLHDSVTQLIFSITLIAQSIGTAYRRDPAEGERRIGRVLELSQQALAEMRALLAELRPTSPVPSGLLPALRQHISRVEEREKLARDKSAREPSPSDRFSIDLTADGYSPHSREWEEALYRVVQESLNNVVKHARAKQVRIRLEQKPGSLHLSVADDGRGFSPGLGLSPEAQAAGGRLAGGLGLTGMRERVERLGGTLQITSAPGEGTTIQVILPEKALGEREGRGSPLPRHAEEQG